jgi:beta-lactamase regulating signal transducer with metallopeptidase domain
MTDTLRLIDHPLIATLGWTLTHFVWQGAVLGLVAFILLRVARPERASTRYLIGVGTLAAMLLVPVVTFVSTSGATASSRVSWRSIDALPMVSGAGAVTGSMVASFEQNPRAVRQWLPTGEVSPGTADVAPIAPIWLPIVTAVWMLGVVALSLRLVGGWALAQMLAWRAVSAVSADVQFAAREMARRLALSRRFAVLQSGAVSVPTLVGWIKPVVLLPAAALTGLTPLQLQAVIAHELAHIRRHDYLVNLLQSFVETLLFYHPAVWWVSSEVRAEREHCCDDLAVEVCGDRLVYVTALAELTSIERRAFALAATDGSLVARVRRILGRPTSARLELPPSWGILVLLVLVGSGAGTYEMSADAADVKEIARAAAAPDARAVDEARWSEKEKAVEQSAEPQAVPPLPPPPPATPVPLPPVVPPRSVIPVAPPVPVMPLPPLPPPAAPTVDYLIPPPTPAVTPAPPMPVVPPAHAEFLLPALAPPALPATPVAIPVPAVHPVPPLSPAPPAPPAVSIQKGEGNFSWSNNGERLAVRWTGPFRLSDDERDIAWVEEGARLTIAEGWVFTDRIELRGLAGGAVERKFYRSGVEKDFEAEGRAFLVTAIQRMIRSGMFASERVARFLKQGGPEAVIAQIDQLGTDSSYVKRVYFSALLKQADLTSPQLTTVLERVSKGISSDYEKATLFIQILQETAVTGEQRVLVLRAAKNISSDYEQRRVIVAGLGKGPLTPELTTAALDAVETISSAHERSQVLTLIARLGGVTPQTSSRFMTAVSTMPSAHEQQQVLAAVAAAPSLPEPVALDAMKAAASISSPHSRRQALSAYMGRSDSSPKVAAAALASAATINSDFEKSQVLLEVVAKGGVNESTGPSFFAAVKTINSSFEVARVLKALIAKGQLSDKMLTGVLDAAKEIDNSHERSTLLLAMLKTQTISSTNRNLFLDVAEGISSSYEQNQVLAALVRTERR